ncbi:MAG TPA: glycosyl hydrolase family 79 C-terminal domain-containing protein [Solirubrobacteraceae bacterium]
MRLRRISRRTGYRWVAAAIVVLVASAGIGLALAAPGPKPPTFTVGRATVGGAVPNGFVGLSMEPRGLETYAGTDPAAINPAFVQLVRNLAPGQSPVLRIGGDGTDWTWYPVAHLRQPPGVKFGLDKRWLKVGSAVAKALNARLILGINLEANSRRVAGAEGRAFVSGIGRKAIRALEIGNEPELYGSFGWYRNAAGLAITGRPRGYDFPDYKRDFSSFAASLPKIALAGPSSGSVRWNALLGSFLSSEPKVRLVTLHAYPLKHCSASSHPTVSQLLSPLASAGLAAGLSQYVAVARRHGLGVQIDELNGISCGGVRGVSDSFASSLWVLDALYQLARAGIAGVNIHTVPNTINEVIGSSQVNRTWQATVHPEYYGMMMFAQAAPAGSRLLRIAGPSLPGVTVWATRAPDGHVRVVLTNRRATAQNVKVRIAGGHGSALLERLQAPSVHATSGVTLGGQSFGGQTSTGLLGGPSSDSVVKSHSGGYAVTLPGGSAALLAL